MVGTYEIPGGETIGDAERAHCRTSIPVAGISRDCRNMPVFAVTYLLILIGLAAFISVYLRVT